MSLRSSSAMGLPPVGRSGRREARLTQLWARGRGFREFSRLARGPEGRPGGLPHMETL